MSDMEIKMIKVPFNVEMAKKITKGEIPGKVVTRDGKNVRIICWDAKKDDNIIALIEYECGEYLKSYPKDGLIFQTGESNADLFLEIPEYLTYKEGDIIYAEVDNGGVDHWKWLSIIREVDYIAGLYLESYVDYNLESPRYCESLYFDQTDDNIDIIRPATEEEKTKFKERLKKSNDPKAKEYLKRFFGEENSPKVSNSSKIGEFKPFDRVLVRQSDADKWEAMLFSNYTSEIHRYRCGGMNYMYCIPYEGNEHLLCTTKS